MRISAPNIVTIIPQFGSPITVANYATSNTTGIVLETPLVALNQAAMYAASIVGTAGAGNKAIAELNNPNASGKILAVYALDFFAPVAMAINLVLAGTTLAPAGTGFNMKIGGAASVAKVGGGNQLAPTGSLVYTSPTIAANTDYVIPLPWLVYIPANNNIQLQGQTVNQAFTCNVRWLEAPS